MVCGLETGSQSDIPHNSKLINTWDRLGVGV